MKEYDESFSFVQSMNWLNLDVFHLVNENTVKNKAYIGKMKRMGWQAGVPDYLVFIPAHKSLDGFSKILWIEMKRAKKQLQRDSINGKKGDWIPVNTPTEKQLQVLGKLCQPRDCAGTVAYGEKEATDYVLSFLRKKV